MRKYSKIHQHVTSEHRAPRAVPLSEVSVPFRASVQAFRKKCGAFRVLRCFFYWAGGSDRVMSALSRDVHCFWFCSTTQKQRLLKESRKIERNIYHLVKSEKVYITLKCRNIDVPIMVVSWSASIDDVSGTSANTF